MPIKAVEDIELKGKRVIVRCDFNVPLDENLVITDEKRIVASLPTILLRTVLGRILKTSFPR